MEETPVTESDITAVAVQAAADLTPVNKVESALSEFVKDTFGMVNEDYAFNRLLREQLIQKMNANELNASQMVMLYTTDSVNISDRMSKTLSPLMQLLTAKQQAEMAKTQKETSAILTSSNINDASKIAPSDVMIGLKALADLARAMPKSEEAAASS